LRHRKRNSKNDLLLWGAINIGKWVRLETKHPEMQLNILVDLLSRNQGF